MGETGRSLLGSHCDSRSKKSARISPKGNCRQAIARYPCHWLLCSFQGPGRGTTRPRELETNRSPNAGERAGLSKLNSMRVIGWRRLHGRNPPDRHGVTTAASGFLRSVMPVRALPQVRSTLLGRSLEAIAAHKGLPRKEVIQPQLPLRLPCYDFTPIMSHTLDGCPLAVGTPASRAAHFRDVTGGVYKARERIHHVILIRDY